MKKHYILSGLVAVFILSFAAPVSAATFGLADDQPLFSAVQTDSGVAAFTKYPTWLRSSLEKAGWIKKGKVIDSKTALEIETRLCREFLGGTDAQCRNPESSGALYVVSALAQYASLDRTSAPDTLLTSAAIKQAITSQLALLRDGKLAPCDYSMIPSAMGLCAALAVGTKGFPGVTKVAAAKQVKNAETRYKELAVLIDGMEEEDQVKYLKELISSGLSQDLKLMQTALAKKKYTEAYLAGFTFGWVMESVTIELQKDLGKRSPVTAAAVAERKKLYEREIASFVQRHQMRGADDAYLLRYGVYARNVRNLQEVLKLPSFNLRQTNEQLGTFDIALDIISMIDLGAKAKI